jgi:hypothetical protein
MGANATTFVPSYTSGEVLTAANLSVTNSGIPVFATTVTRDAAFGGTGEKTLAEGQFAYIEATNTTQYYDGAAWVAVGASGLTYITGASFSAAAAVNLPTNSFSTTYDNYKLMLRLTAASAGVTLRHRYRAAGTDDTSLAYQWGYGGYDGAFEGNLTTDTFAIIGGLNAAANGFNALSMDIFAPKLSVVTYHALTGWGIEIAAATNAMTYWASGRFSNTTSFDSMSFFPASGTITGDYKLYGYSNS